MAAPDDTAITKSVFQGTAGEDFVPASGSLSGTVSAFSGPWYVERQTLDIYYYRMPHQFGAPNLNVSLTGTTATSSAPVYTYLTYYAIASYDTQISYQNFNSSSVQQPQEFTINAASADANGVNYGAITSATMGPMGTIITSKPFIRRTPYLGTSSQPLVSKVSTGSNFAALIEGISSVGIACITPDATPHLGDQEWFKDFGCQQGTVRYGHPYNIPNGFTNPRHYRFSNDYTINGAYDTSKESMAQIQTFIDTVGMRVTNENHFVWPSANNNGETPLRDEGFVEYDINRHA